MIDQAFNMVFIETTGICNAKCPWCQTGIKARNGNPAKAPFMDKDDFIKIIRKMRVKRLIGPNTLIALYNWYEPFLHPQLKEIVHYLHTLRQPFHFSTNASKFVEFNDNELVHCKQLRISLPGFSQESYDKVHGFKFNRIIENILKMVTNFRSNGFNGEVVLAFLATKFNISEMDACKVFAKQLNATFSTGVASLNSYHMQIQYLTDTMPAEQREKAHDELFLDYVEDMLENRPADWECPQHNILTIDSECNASLCCAVDKDSPDYLVGNMLELTADQILKNKMAKKNCQTCKKCMQLGVSYWSHNLPKIVNSAE